MTSLILIVDDEADLVATLDYNLRREGYETRSALTGAGALAALQVPPAPDLVILDLMLPDMPGTEVCRRLRSIDATRATPVLMLTAKGDEIDRVVGFEVGADDYVTKPFSVRELMLRVGAILRRAHPDGGGEPAAIAFGRLRMDREAHRVWVDGDEVALTALEFRLLSTFLDRRGRVQSRDTLLTDVWGMSPDVTTRTVDTHVKRLREKLGPAGAYVETLRGVGYRFRDAPDE
ncbi:MAG TPA: response regulator transcription factor [Kofleriaceae bacterium]|nr:response regulator transcription factor [Kofleriaceae bacterium]